VFGLMAEWLLVYAVVPAVLWGMWKLLDFTLRCFAYSARADQPSAEEEGKPVKGKVF